MVVVVEVAVLSVSKEVSGEDPRSSILVVMTALSDRVYSTVVFSAVGCSQCDVAVVVRIQSGG